MIKFAKPLAAVIALALGGCALTPVYERPAVPLPARYENAATAPAAAAPDAEWWQRFGSTELDQLISEALAANHDLAAAVSRIEQARASARAVGAARFPEVGASASASRDRRDVGAGTGTSSSDRAGVTVAYELDLWGGRAADIASAEARVASSTYRRDSVALVLQSDVAADYFQILALKDRLVIARQNLDAARRLMDLVQVRFDNGAAAALELAQQRTTLLSIEAEIPVLEQNLKQTQHALAILLGRAPEGFAVKAASLRELKLPAIDAGTPATIIERRPDIRVAEADLIAANADIGAARAALYPQVDLSASAAFTGLAVGPATSAASLAASLAQTLFDGGRRRAAVELTQAQRRELAENYVQAVLVALKEVEDNLVAASTAGTRAGLVAQQVEQAQKAYDLALIRYRSGAENLLELLDSQRTRLASEDNLVLARLASFTASSDLFKALGGGWEPAAAAVQ